MSLTSNLLPEWTRSVRFRLALLYSLALFSLAAILTVALYFALNRSVRSEPVSETFIVNNRVVVTDVHEFERAVNEHTLETLRELSLAGLGLLFIASLGIGWVIAGRVLLPIGEITDVANEIEATDLARRIELQGPDDELKRLADTFDRMLGRLDKSFEMQKAFIADASHELRNPLTIIRTNVDVLLDDPKPSPEAVRRAGDVLRRATERMGSLVDDLLSLARLETAGSSREALDVRSLLIEASVEHAASAGAAKVRIEVVDPSVTLTVDADCDALKRALANLVDNALRYAPVDTTIQLTAGSEDEWVWFGVTDEGWGVAHEDHERVFERFFRTDRSRARASGGSGLGLAIVRQIAEAHSGKATVSSEPGAGATFTIWLPRRVAEPPSVEIDPSVAAGSP